MLSGHSAVEQHSQLAGFCYSLSLGPFNNLYNVVTEHLGHFAYNIVIPQHTEKPPHLYSTRVFIFSVLLGLAAPVEAVPCLHCLIHGPI